MKAASPKTKIKNFTKKDIEDRIYEKLIGKQLTQKIIVTSFFESVRELLMEAAPTARIEIRDFGIFEVKKTKPKPKARNIKTGEFVFVPGRRKILFRPGKILKNFLKEKY